MPPRVTSRIAARAVLVAVLAAATAACPSPPDRGADGTAEDADSDVMAPSEVVDSETAASPGDAGCSDEAGCPSDDPCSVGRCVEGQCVFEPATCQGLAPCFDGICRPGVGCILVPNLARCDDGDRCTDDDRCDAGLCHGRALDCDDGEACTTDRCDAASGCVQEPRVGPCDDDDACSVDDACLDGVCTGTPRTCPGAPGSHGCSLATCDPRTGCGLRESTGPCDDGDACTLDTACVGGACVGTLATCDDHDPCTDDACDPVRGCVATDNRAPCEDGDPCTAGDRCAAGVCVAGPATACCAGPEDCDDHDPCTDDACVEGHCATTPRCDDGNPCTVDACDGGVCAHALGALVPAEGLAFEGFEGALDARWELASDNPLVAWQRDDSFAVEGHWSLYVGHLPDHSYDYGPARATATWRGPVPADASRLTVFVRSAVAETSCSYDALVVSLDGAPLTPAVCGSNGAGLARSWDIASAAGRVAALTFAFDTVDADSNDAEGVWIDALRFEREGRAMCCVDAADCDAPARADCPASTCEDNRCHASADPTCR